jgi:serine/threonine protein kinase
MTSKSAWERVCPACGAPFSNGESFCPHDGSQLVASKNNPPPDRMLNQVLDGRFVLQKVLGEGGMGVVYLARHRVLERQFAVKLLRRELVGDNLARRRFEREARIASAVMHHPHIVQIYDCGHTLEGRAYLVMEYVDGTSLHTLAGNAPNRQLHLSQTVDIVLQLTQALIAAHSRGIVHRDIKPERVTSSNVPPRMSV